MTFVPHTEEEPVSTAPSSAAGDCRGSPAPSTNPRHWSMRTRGRWQSTERQLQAESLQGNSRSVV